jgi:hypothetical protein
MGKTIIRGLSRRQFVGTGLGLAAGLALVGNARAQASLDKEAVQYQETPHEGQRCDECVFWIPGSDPQALGACQMVKGEIHPDGWCAIWAAKG